MRQSPRGFTLMEMLLVIAIIGILASMSIPRYRESVRRAREAVFQENVYMLRATIERFTLDQKRPPTSLEELVTFGYLGGLPGLARAMAAGEGFSPPVAFSGHAIRARGAST